MAAPPGSGPIEFSIQQVGANDSVLGSSGWQSAEHWFSFDDPEAGDGFLWVSLPAAAVGQIQFKNYSVSVKRAGGSETVSSVLTGV